MSFILDALKKSENERQRRTGPSLADVRTGAPERKRPPWLIPLIGLLAINLVAAAAVLLWPGERDVPLPRQAAAERRPPSTPPSSPRPAPPAATPRIDPDPPPAKPTPAPRPPVRSLAAETAPEAQGAPPQAPAAAIAPPPRPTRPSPGTIVDEDVPTFAQLVVDGRLSLPNLHVDIHVYSAKPKGRFVFVNNKKYREGDFLNEGPRVEEISTTGVILSHQGHRFLLPRD